MSKHFNYQLHVDGVPQDHMVRMTPAEAEHTNETMARFGKCYHVTGEPPRSTPFGVVNVDGTRQHFEGFAAFNRHLRNGGMAEDRRRAVAYINSLVKPVRRAA